MSNISSGDLTCDVVICGAGIAGISAAYHLVVKKGIKKVILIDEREPMTFTSDKSSECYRNWWPGPGDTMVRFMNRSIDLLEDLADESNNFFRLNRRGYVFLTGDSDRAASFKKTAEEITKLGAGPLRIHDGHTGAQPYNVSPAEGYRGQPIGADLVLDSEIIQNHFPFITENAIAMLHPRRCGWLSAQQLGMYLLRQAEANGLAFLSGKISAVNSPHGRISSLKVDNENGSINISTRCFVIASGPFVRETGQMIDVDIPVFNELHGKIALQDPLQIVPRSVPLMIWEDPVSLYWTDEERKELETDEEHRWLLETFPSGVHFRPEGGEGSPILLALWTYDIKPQEVIWPPKFDYFYPEIILRGLVHMVPGLKAYIARMKISDVDGGYYCKTQENRPLISPLPVDGAFLYGAISGFGIMAGMAGGELLAAHVTGDQLPDYSDAFHLKRYDDPTYQQLLAEWDSSSGQL